MNRYGIFNSIEENFQFIRSNPSDQMGEDSIHWIAPYMDILYEYASKCKHITEMGINQVNSTWAFLRARPEKLISIDIDLHTKPTKKLPELCGINIWLNSAIKLAERERIQFQVVEGDTTKIVIENTDLLFIDTLHTKKQLETELTLHAGKVRKYIILHDTKLFGHELIPALTEFLKKNKQFRISKVISTGCGLTILKRRLPNA